MSSAQQPRPDGGARRIPTGRGTKQKDAVVSALARAETFSSAQDLHRRMTSQGTAVGLATIYRHLQALVESGQVDAVRTEDGQTLYRYCGTERHHHHLVCRRCGRTVEVVAGAV